jgi:hypothetical protein
MKAILQRVAYTLADEFGKYMHQFVPTTTCVHVELDLFPKTALTNPEFPNVDFADVRLT